MSNLQIPYPIWLLRTFFLSIAYCVTFFQQVQPAAVTDPIEVIALNSLAEKWNIEDSDAWNLTGDPCTGRAIDSTDIAYRFMNPAFKCDCAFNNGNTCHIVKMKVYAMDITEQIPPELANLTQLSVLNLAQNYLTGPIPAFIGNLTRMQYLSLGLNNLSGPVPKELANLRSLISLSFSSNNLNGSLPPELGSLTALEQLVLENNERSVGGKKCETYKDNKESYADILTVSSLDNLFTEGVVEKLGTFIVRLHRKMDEYIN